MTICPWCDQPINGPATVADGQTMHAACATARAEHLRTGVTTMRERSASYLFIDTCTDDKTEPPRPATFQGFLDRFKTRHGKSPSPSMEAFLREAYKAGAVDGAGAAVRLAKMGKR